MILLFGAALNKSVECAVLFADVADSTGLYARFGDVRARELLSQSLATMFEVSRRCEGQVVKTIGDEVMCRFDRAEQAVHAAVGIQEALEYRTRLDGLALAAHVGLHFGVAFVDDNDVHGDAANIAANMTSIAKPGQIITTQDTVERLSPEVCALTRLYDVVTLKGSQKKMPIFEVLWEQGNATSILTRTDFQALWPASRMSLVYKSKELIALQDAPVIVMGRGSGCDLIVDASLVSRVHASIEYRRDKFVLIDQSTNGTFVRAEDGQEVYLRREEMPLLRRGHISLGRVAGPGDGDSISYSVE